MLTDTHCHLAASDYDADRPEVLERAWAAGVGRVVVIGESPEAAERALALGQGEPRLAATAGLHPHEASRWSEETREWLRSMLRRPGVVAAGEMGLDYHYDHSPREAQRAAFEDQLRLAREADQPVVIHAREADDDVAALLRAHSDVTAILHSFSSGPGLLRAGLDLRHYVSFSGMVTFRNWQLDDAVRAVPIDRLLLETDGPYLAPVPHRGKRNEPAYVPRTIEHVARARGVDAGAIAELTARNAERLFGLAVAQAPR